MLRLIAAISGIYDVLLGVGLLAARPVLMQAFDVPAPVPPIHADLNGLFAIAIGVGYWWPYRDPLQYRGYLWVMGTGLKGLGAMWFIGDYVLRDSPAMFLLFAAFDGILAVVTTWGLLRREEHKASRQ